MHNRYLVFTLFFIVFTLDSHAKVFINELMSRNVSYAVNENFNFEGWVELYNSETQAINLSDYYFSDDEENPYKWKIKSEALEADGHCVIYFDELDEKNHANFKLKAEGGVILLTNSNGGREDRIVYPAQYRNISYGRRQDGGFQVGFFEQPTPGRTNNTETSFLEVVQVAAPLFDVPAGFYTQPQTVTMLTATADAKIYYTIDGSEPKPSDSLLYTTPVLITQNTPLRAVAIKEGELPSDITTASYFINSGSLSLPVVSLTTDAKFLFGDELGILVKGTNGSEVPDYCISGETGYYANYWNDWDRPCNFEYFDAERQQHLNQEVKVGNLGNCSRTKFVKSIKINATKVHGGIDDGNKLNYAIFKSKPNLKWKSVVLRNSGNDMGYSFLRDGFMQSLLKGRMDVDYQAYEPAVVYINGKYYGMLNIRERSNKDYIYSNYGLDEDQIYLVEGAWGDGSVADYQDLISLSYWNNLNTNTVYQQVEEGIDLDEFLNYFVAQIYFANSDWPGGNIKAWKRIENGKFRWILYDTDFGFSLYEDKETFNAFINAENQHRFFLFLKNDRIKEKFITKFVIHLATTFNPDRVITVLDSIKEHVNQDAHVFESYLRANGAMEAYGWRSNSWDDELNKIMKGFARKRPSNVYQHLKEYFSLGDTTGIRIYADAEDARFMLNDEKLLLPEFNGLYYKGLKIKITPIIPQGYKFKKWEITRQNEEPVSVSDSVYQGVFEGDDVSYKAITEKDTSWTEPLLPSLFLNEICITNSQYVDEYFESDDWIELHNAGNSAINIAGMYLSDNRNDLLKYQVSNADFQKTTIPAGGYLIIWADGQPSQGALHANFSLSATKQATVFISEVIDDELYVIDSVTYKLHKKGETFARFSFDGNGNWKVTSRPTFAAANELIYPVDVPPVVSDGNIAQLYPNPASETIRFLLTSEQATVLIIDYMGRQLSAKKISNGEELNVTHLPRGLYLAVIISDEGKQVIKFIKR